MQALAEACPFARETRNKPTTPPFVSHSRLREGTEPARPHKPGPHRFDSCSRNLRPEPIPSGRSVPRRRPTTTGGHDHPTSTTNTPRSRARVVVAPPPNRPGRTFTTASPFPTGRRTAPNWQSPPAHSPLAGGCRSPALRPVCTHTKPGWSQTARAHGRPFPTTHLTYPHATIGQGLPETRLPAPTTMPGPLAAPTRPPAVEPVMVPEP